MAKGGRNALIGVLEVFANRYRCATVGTRVGEHEMIRETETCLIRGPGCVIRPVMHDA